jgi:glycine betaine/proline transport system ATP-binding protein
MTIIDIANLDVVFGKKPQQALSLLDQGKSRSEIKEKTGQIVGVHDATLSINQGEIFVLMGLSGSGKSTLLRAINGLLPIARGQISLFLAEENNLKSFQMAGADDATLRYLRMHHIAMVFQKFALLPWRTVSENVAFGLEIAGVHKILIEKKVKDSLSMVGLGQWAHQYPSELSGGMQQRVGLARAIATDAQILLMDEPFSALDPLIRAHLQQELLTLQKTLHKTIIFVTHDLDEALKIGSRIAIMQEGKIVQQGSAEEIITHPKTAVVKDFVAHIDQTKLLRAKALMTSIGELKVSDKDASVMLERSGTYRCLLDENGRPRRSLCGDTEGRIIPWTLFQSGTFSEYDIVLGNEHLMIKDVIDVVGRTKRPMVIQDHAGKMIGAVTTDSILQALSMK